jgi:hypothetical protein
MHSFLFITLFFLSQSLLKAEYIDPGDVQVSTERYSADTTTLKAAEYTYDLSWQGIPVGSASIKVTEDVESPHDKDKSVGIVAEAKSTKVVDVFYKLRHLSESQVSKKDFKPSKFKTWQTENTKIKSAEVVFSKDGSIHSFVEKDGKVDKKSDFISNNFTLDPISAAFFAKSIPIKVGQTSSFDVFNGKHRYLIEFNVVALEEIEVMGKKRSAFKAVPKVIKLTDTEGEKRLNEAAIWIANDETREVLKLHSKVFVGSVGATLVKVENPSANLKLASTKEN